MTPTRTRIGVLGGVFGAALVVVLLHLWLLMVNDHEIWARRSHANRWSFKAVPSQRGALLDRYGRELAVDEPTTDLAVLYERFRLRHPVGAAVHGAIALARVRGDDASHFGYGDGALGPDSAMRTLLAMPAGLLRQGVLEKHVAAELRAAVATVLAACSGRPRAHVFAALRQAARSDATAVVGDVLGLPRGAIIERFQQWWRALQRLDGELRGAVAHDAAPRRAGGPGLLVVLGDLQAASLDGRRVTWTANGERHFGIELESVQRVFASQVPFDVAAELRVAGEDWPGIDVLPSVRRLVAAAPDTSLARLIGSVLDVDRTLPPKGEQWLATVASSDLPEPWLASLQPPDLDGDGDDDDAEARRDALRSAAHERYRRALLARGRRGTRGFEAAFDAELRGRLGLRLVEHDASHREQQLWSHLRVEAGDDVRITIDVDLQRHAEAATVAGWQRQLHGTDAQRADVQAALAVIDAGTGDVLAYAGAPLATTDTVVPGLVWSRNGALGSVVKPFVLAEQIRAETEAAPHRPIATLDPCDASFRHSGMRLTCSHQHWDDGRDPVKALGESCNLFYYQCALGLGEAGVHRALRRFGLAPSVELVAAAGDTTGGDGADPFAACWQPALQGVRVASPQWLGNTTLPHRAVGYGIAATPLHVARAYAALATGSLPTLGLRPEPRARVPLHDVEPGMSLVRDGLRHCITDGTARRLELLQQLGVEGKTGTAEIHADGHNNAWFAGYLPPAGTAGVQLCFCAVVYGVQDRVHGGDAAGQLVVDFLRDVRNDAATSERYLPGEQGR